MLRPVVAEFDAELRVTNPDDPSNHGPALKEREDQEFLAIHLLVECCAVEVFSGELGVEQPGSPEVSPLFRKAILILLLTPGRCRERQQEKMKSNNNNAEESSRQLTDHPYTVPILIVGGGRRWTFTEIGRIRHASHTLMGGRLRKQAVQSHVSYIDTLSGERPVEPSSYRPLLAPLSTAQFVLLWARRSQTSPLSACYV